MPNANDQATYGDAFVTYGDVEWTYDGTRRPLNVSHAGSSTIRPRDNKPNPIPRCPVKVDE